MAYNQACSGAVVARDGYMMGKGGICMAGAYAAVATGDSRGSERRSSSGRTADALPPPNTRPLPGTMLCMALVALAIGLGGGGTVNPRTEMVLQVLTTLIMIPLVASSEWQRGLGHVQRSAWLLAALVLLMPVLQLVPLPPSVWQQLPGRAIEMQSLALVGADQSWMPLTMAPARTFASLLAIICPILLMLQVSRLSSGGRSWICGAVAVCGGLSLLLGVLQLSHTGGWDWSLYTQYSEGFLVGFQANRNAEADILLIAALAYGTLIANRSKPGRKSATAVALAMGILPILVGVVMTGSRTGVALVSVVVLTLGVMYWPIFKPGRRMLLGLFAGFGGLVVAAALLAQLPAVNKTVARFAFTREARWDLWADTVYAARQVWPFGSGIGTIVPMLEAAERLDEVDPTSPVRAHNDWLEFVLEGGLPGVVILSVLLAIVMFLIFAALKQSMTSKAGPAHRAQTLFATGVLLVIGLHSIVDYPLRSMALAALAALAVAFLCSLAAAQRNHR